MTVDLARSGRRAPTLFSVGRPIVAAGSLVRLLLALVASVAAIGLLLIAPAGTIEGALALAIPCLLVRLRRAEF